MLRVRPRRNHRRLDEIRKALGVARRDAIAGDALVGEDRKLLEQHRGLQGVEARRQSDTQVFVAVLALAVHAHLDQLARNVVVVGEQRTAVAVAAQRL